MKKIIVLILLLFILVFNAYSNQNSFTLSNFFSGKIESYYNNFSLCGETLELKTQNIDNVLKKLNANVINSEYILDQKLTIIYCYSTLVPQSVILKGKEINLQICIADEYVVVGWPMINGSF